MWFEFEQPFVGEEHWVMRPKQLSWSNTIWGLSPLHLSQYPPSYKAPLPPPPPPEVRFNKNSTHPPFCC